MSDPEDKTIATTTASSTDFFESIGKKANQLAPSTNGHGTNGIANVSAEDDDDDDGKVVEQIESLCMNCHENVCLRPQPQSVEPR